MPMNVAHINANYMQQTIECYYERRVKILECVFQRVTADGVDNRSDIYRAHVKFYIYRGRRRVRNEMTLIVKFAIMVGSAQMGTNELVMFKHVLPNVKLLLADISAYQYEDRENDNNSNTSKLCADCLFCERGEQEVFILEDLKACGYERVDHRKGLDLEQSKAVMLKLADFHAVSMVYMKMFRNTAATLFPSPMANGISPTSRKAITVFDAMRNAIKMVEQWTDFGGIVASMRIWMENFNERLTQVLQNRRCGFKVITHGELWAQNLLMRLGSTSDNNKEPCDIAFVDFHLSFIGSCGYDLNVFLNTSVQLDVLKSHRYELLRDYHNRLSKTLEYLWWPMPQIPTWETVWGEVHDLEFIGYYAMLCLLPKSCMDTTAATQEEQHKSMYENERVQEMFRYGLKRFETFGVFSLESD